MIKEGGRNYRIERRSSWGWGWGWRKRRASFGFENFHRLS